MINYSDCGKKKKKWMQQPWNPFHTDKWMCFSQKCCYKSRQPRGWQRFHLWMSDLQCIVPMLWHVDKQAQVMSFALRHLFIGSPQIIPKIIPTRSIISLKSRAISTPSSDSIWFWLVTGGFSRLARRGGRSHSDSDWRCWHLNLSPASP